MKHYACEIQTLSKGHNEKENVALVVVVVVGVRQNDPLKALYGTLKQCLSLMPGIEAFGWDRTKKMLLYQIHNQ